jgi:hypothetical protein
MSAIGLTTSKRRRSRALPGGSLAAALGGGRMTQPVMRRCARGLTAGSRRRSRALPGGSLGAALGTAAKKVGAHGGTMGSPVIEIKEAARGEVRG